MGNGIGQGDAGLRDLPVPALVGTFPLPRTQHSGKLNPYISDVDFSIPEVDVEDVGQWDRHMEGICKNRCKNFITGMKPGMKAARGGGEPQVQLNLR